MNFLKLVDFEFGFAVVFLWGILGNVGVGLDGFFVLWRSLFLVFGVVGIVDISFWRLRVEIIVC